MRNRNRICPLAVVMALALTLVLGGCTGGAGGPKAGVKFPKGKMLHLQQVLERYDADGNAVPQYLELWLTKDAGRCVELDAEGNEVSVALDSGKSHIRYDSVTRKAVKADESAVFVVGLQNMKKAYPRQSSANEGEYAGRACTLYLLEGSGEDEWVKLYADSGTGMVLLCDAPLFRLRTALIEEVALDDSLFQAPDDLVFEGGDGK